MCREQGIIPAHIAVAVAAGYLFDPEEDAIALEVSGCAKNEGIAVALEKYSGITDPADVAMIGKFYEMLKNGADFGEFVTELDRLTE